MVIIISNIVKGLVILLTIFMLCQTVSACYIVSPYGLKQDITADEYDKIVSQFLQEVYNKNITPEQLDKLKYGRPYITPEQYDKLKYGGPNATELMEYFNSQRNTTNSENGLIKNESLKSSDVKIKNLDKSPPKIIGQSQKVSRKNIHIKINEKIEKGSQWSKIILKNSKGVVIISKKEIKGNYLIITPNKKLNKYSKYYVYLPSGSIKDKNGNNIQKYVLKFKTGSK